MKTEDTEDGRQRAISSKTEALIIIIILIILGIFIEHHMCLQKATEALVSGDVSVRRSGDSC